MSIPKGTSELIQRLQDLQLEAESMKAALEKALGEWTLHSMTNTLPELFGAALVSRGMARAAAEDLEKQIRALLLSNSDHMQTIGESLTRIKNQSGRIGDLVALGAEKAKQLPDATQFRV